MAPPKNMAALHDRIKQYVKLEEDRQGDRQFASQEGTKKEKKKFENKNGKEKYSKKDPKPTSYEAIANKPYFRRPNKMSGDPSTRNQSKWCSYHRDKCHRTEDCREFKRHLEELVQQGHLKEFIDKEKTAAEKKAEPQSKEWGEPSHYVVNFIDAMVPDAQLGNAIRRTEYRRVQHQQEVMRMDLNPSLGTKRPMEATAITFTKEDATGVIFPHNDALVISLQIGAATVKRMIVDQGSSTEIMYYSLFQKLGKTHADLILVPTHQVGLNATPVCHLGRIRMPVTAGPRIVEVDFLVIDLPSTYNAIMGRTWLHLMEAVPSSYHQMLKFPFGDKVVEIRGDQAASKECFMAKIKQAGKIMMMEEEAPILE
ncbi:uncharacterized protein LOC119998516 [Tripterygium wilfordii]|uniref:uncharacterized protein LOC119998516 n=1 Tax=Tripterygium wilfordii TaxID=458696 RepID=UPI0018F7F04A|nr:uncharacterized protein LOC119998516 [Tripterygium wilfordii]